ncbi:hypothetical protein H2203_005334 [Taxawa tesnikishii (nom. ined.)]|nr:hypothetical protein H2203_005334 [Dothideales sp. JES 119]
MASPTNMKETLTLPQSSEDQIYVTISALDAGHLTLPERLFITDADPEKRSTVPSLSFLIQHPAGSSATHGRNATNLVFDLGLKRDFTGYAPAQQAHISQRQPTVLSPDAGESLRKGGLDPAKDVDIVMLSHVHWDHVGTPSDFPNAKFVEIFNADELPADRTWELPPVREVGTAVTRDRQTDHKWQTLAQFPAVVDFFGDGSVYVVDAPGHLYGHVNLLARTGPNRILKGEKGIAMYDDGRGGLRSVHVDTETARGTVGRIGKLLKTGEMVPEGAEVEVVVAHDRQWREKNQERFWPGRL